MIQITLTNFGHKKTLMTFTRVLYIMKIKKNLRQAVHMLC